jgi:hypothetical protein
VDFRSQFEWCSIITRIDVNSCQFRSRFEWQWRKQMASSEITLPRKFNWDRKTDGFTGSRFRKWICLTLNQFPLRFKGQMNRILSSKWNTQSAEFGHHSLMRHVNQIQHIAAIMYYVRFYISNCRACPWKLKERTYSVEDFMFETHSPPRPEMPMIWFLLVQWRAWKEKCVSLQVYSANRSEDDP